VYHAGIDIGGTNIKAGLFDSSTGSCVERATLPTADGVKVGEVPGWADAVQTLLAGFEAQHAMPGIPVGISAPGLASRDARMIEWMRGRMEGLEGFVWADFLGREVTVLNDAHAALLGEVWQGAARGEQDVVMLTLGTGVGGGVISGGHLLTGHRGRAGHLGHITVSYRGARDIVGTPGSLEDAVGNATVAARSGGRFQSTRDLLEAHQTGDAEARAIWQESMRALTAGLVSLINCFDPETVILGGGIAAGAWDLICQEVEPLMESQEWCPGGHRVKLVQATLGEWAGAYGAAHAVQLARPPLGDEKATLPELGSVA
jgi:glucokinase